MRRIKRGKLNRYVIGTINSSSKSVYLNENYGSRKPWIRDSVIATAWKTLEKAMERQTTIEAETFIKYI